MACPENNMHPQTESKKKAIAAIHEHLRPYKKRRSILHDLTTVSNNAVAAPEKSLLHFNKPVALLTKPCIYDDIYEYLRCMEVDPRPLPDYIEKVQCKDEVTASTGAILVGQFVEIFHGCQLGSDILHSCVAYIDLFLSLNNWTIDKMVLLGFSALVLAS
ncbi:hypothetical protein Fmac_032361 [Flemingia macrophylla]|uniref:B-like cyclin n=1 Tax=Flemingia macrophylla TaxID=520843 RepID=A0ABD1L621_9FABA